MKRLEFAECILQVEVAVDPLDGINVGAVGEVSELVLDVVRTTRDVPEDVSHEHGVKVVNLGVTRMMVCAPQLGDLEAV